MALDHLQNSGLTRALTDLLADLAELVQKEIAAGEDRDHRENHLPPARERLDGRWPASWEWSLRLLIVEAAVFAIASFGLALHWSCLLVAAVLIADSRRCLLSRTLPDR